LKVITAILIFSILFQAYGTAQQDVFSLSLYNYQFDHLTFENGLSHIKIKMVAKGTMARTHSLSNNHSTILIL